MSYLSNQYEYQPLDAYLRLAGNPTFLLRCLGPKEFVMERLGDRHTVDTGLDPKLCEGKMPHEFLPTRVADTVVANYETCRLSKEPFSYTEVLELPSGKRWWRTTLTPIMDATGDVGMIFGSAIDISDVIEQSHQDAQRQAEQNVLNERLKVFASMSAKGAQGPLQTVLGLLNLVKDGFLDLGDEKFDQLTLADTIIRDALGSMDGVISDLMELSAGSQNYSAMDLGHACRDIFGLVDPDGRFEVAYPNAELWANSSLVQLVLTQVIENAMKYATRCVSVRCEVLPGDMLSFTISDDGVGLAEGIRCDGTPILPEPTGKGPLSDAVSLISGCGGTIGKAANGAAQSCAITFTIPGRVVTDRATG